MLASIRLFFARRRYAAMLRKYDRPAALAAKPCPWAHVGKHH